MSSPLHLGVTGGIGSGKSTVCRIFESLGYQVYYADDRAKKLMVSNQTIVSGVKALFGEEAYQADGSLNRPHIGAIAFSNQEKLSALNALVHPETAKDYLLWAKEVAENNPRSFVLKEAAILYESGAYRYSDAVLTVYAPKQIRLARVMQRDGADETSIKARMAKQWPEQRKMALSDFLILNDGGHHLIPQVLRVIDSLTQR